jgi:hypothetical protein
MGADINSNIGTLEDLHSTEFCAALGPYDLPKHNKKDGNLLHVYLAHQLRVMNTFFEARSKSPVYSTWSSNQPTNSGIADTHTMLNVIVCSAILHKHIHNCCTTLIGLDSNHHAVNMALTSPPSSTS